MTKSNTKNIIFRSLAILILLVSVDMHSQNDTIKKKGDSKTFKSYLDSEKKGDGIKIEIPNDNKINPLFNLNPVEKPILKDISYYLNLGSSAPEKELNFMSSRNNKEADVLVQRNFNGKDMSNPKMESNANLGTIESSTKMVRIEFRDHGLVDGDRVRIFLNETIVNKNITLKGLSAFIDLEMKRGYNRIDFMALNQGIYGPNTAAFYVYDDQGKLITAKAWNITTGKVATLGIVRY
tara:strand:- start:26019 stop:26729 length:711 start_codon:yes stop_codon:yes gene_type:complete